MLDKEEVQFSIRLNSKWFRLPPHVQVYLDQDLIEDTEITELESEGDSKHIRFSADLVDGTHRLRIVYSDKELPDTRVDEAGNILDDHLLTIAGIEIDDIDLGFMLYENGIFYPDRNIRPDLPEQIANMTTLGYNGEWVMEFNVPTYIWFLENL